MTYPRVLPVGDRALTVQLGDAIDETTVGRVRALDRRVAERGLEGVMETVPTYAALLTLFDPRRTSFGTLREALLELSRGLDGAVAPGRLVEIPAVYDGEDVPELAEACGLAAESVVELHAGRDYSVLMLGFSPGFAYMGFVDERLRRPRRRTPRTRVPAGAIGVAGVQTGIYPRRLPGGWNLIGRTSTPLFEADAKRPSLLLPGDQVRFVPTSSLRETTATSEPAYLGSGVRVLEPGILTTVQDGGRPGLRRVAVPLAGYADAEAARTANACVGNPPDAPVLEVCGPGLKVRFEKTTFVALGGARAAASLERHDLESGLMPVPPVTAVRVREGNTLAISALEEGTRCFMAIAGMTAPRLLGSASADLGSGFLRPLRTGDGLTIGAFDPDRVRRDPLPAPERRSEIRVILGPQKDHFSEAMIETFLSSAFTVGLDSDRVGARLDGPRLAHSGPSEIVSDGMVPGCVQVPPDGRPIVMLADCPTTGGYPKIGCVVSDDLGVVAQAVPGRTRLRFVACDPTEF